jgi:YHS domain-containing protein
VQDPEVYLRNLGIVLPCAVEPWKHAILDAKYRAYVNHEVYFFSGDRALSEFRKNPLEYCGLVTDPVSGRRFKPKKRSPVLTYDGRPYYFETKKTRAKFEAEPERFKNPGQKKMMEAPAGAGSSPPGAR